MSDQEYSPDITLGPIPRRPVPLPIVNRPPPIINIEMEKVTAKLVRCSKGPVENATIILTNSAGQSLLLINRKVEIGSYIGFINTNLNVPIAVEAGIANEYKVVVPTIKSKDPRFLNHDPENVECIFETKDEADKFVDTLQSVLRTA